MGTTDSSGDFNQNTSRAKKVAKGEPVVVAEHGKLANVLLTNRELRRLSDVATNVGDLLGMPGFEDMELEIPRRRDLATAADLG